MFAFFIAWIPAIVSLSVIAFVLAAREMSSDKRVSLSWVLPCRAFEHISSALQQTAETVEPAVLVLTEAALPHDRATLEQSERFCMVVSPWFSGLLHAKPTLDRSLHDQVELTFAPEAIAAFLTQLSHQLRHDSHLVDRLQQASQQLQVNDPTLQSAFTLRLADLLLAQPAALPAEAVTAALEQQHLLEQRVIERTQELHDALLAAQAANRTKAEFLSAMSHELRTPLTCVIGMADTLLRVMAMKPDTYPLQPQKQQEYLKLIKRSGEHLLELITDILEVSQVEAGKVVLNVKPFSLLQVAQQSLHLLQDRARSKGIELSLKALEPDSHKVGSPDDDDFFIADPHRVSQILLNLLSNAIKFTPAGGRVTLRFGIKHEIAIFQVEDTGIGISESQRPLLFQKFQQLDSSLTRTYEGTGLGLALTKQLVELHNGKIEVNSTVGVGSIFTVWLPAQSVSQSIAHPVSSRSNIIPIAPNFLEADAINRALPIGERVVLIEDHDETALLICDLLTAADCQVVWMVDGATAMKQIELLRPRLIIVNMQLPDLQGDEITHFLREHPTLHTTKVLALMAKALPKAPTIAGIDDYLMKPIEPYQLLDKVTALVGRE